MMKVKVEIVFEISFTWKSCVFGDCYLCATFTIIFRQLVFSRRPPQHIRFKDNLISSGLTGFLFLLQLKFN